MGRLIDEEEVLKRWNELSIRGRTEFDQVIVCMPTAYDVDAVVKQLQQQAEQYHGRAKKCAVMGAIYEVEHMDGKTASYEHSIEIVKGGGINAIRSVGN